MSLLDYHPLIGPWRESQGTSGDQSMMSEEGSFTDAETGQDVDGAYTVCGDCGYLPVREHDANCPGCGEFFTNKQEVWGNN